MSVEKGKIATTGQPLSLDQVKIYGWLLERIDRAYNAVDDLASTVWWSGVDTWGYEHPCRWLSNMVLFGRHKGSFHYAIPEVADRLLKLVAPSTEAGKTKKPGAPIDYAKFTGVVEDAIAIMGLLKYYDVSRDKKALDAAREIGRYVAENHERSKHYYKTIAIEYLLELGEATGDDSFKELAVRIAEEQQLSFLKLEEGVHGAAAAMASENYARLYQATGDRRHLDWALKCWRAIRDRMMATGGIGEKLFFLKSPGESDLHDETCQTSTWFMLNLRLWRLTGDVKFLDVAERVLLNHLFFQQLHKGEGGFSALGDIDQGFRGDHNYFCCDNEGTRGLLTLLTSIYTFQAEAHVLNVNFFFDSEADVALPDGGHLIIRQKTFYPERGVIRLTLENQEPTHLTLRVRIPGWSRPSSVQVNGELVPHQFEDSYISLHRKWKHGDVVNIVFPIPVYVEPDITGEGAQSGRVIINGKDSAAKRLAVLYGSVVMAIFRIGHGNDLSWVWTGDYPEVLDSGGSVFEGCPASKPDLLEIDGQVFHTGVTPEITTVTDGNSIPKICWEANLGDEVKLHHEARVLPGLPVTIEYLEDVQGWNGKGRLQCSGLRFAIIKTNSNKRYHARQNKWPYPFPCLTTKPDLSNVDNLVYGAGTFGLYEQPGDGVELAKTGTVLLNNRFFRAVCLYDTKTVERVSCRQTDKWVGIYLEPKVGLSTMLTKRLVFPLHDKPQGQTTVRQNTVRSFQAHANLTTKPEGELSLELTGPVVQGVPVIIPKISGLKPGSVIYYKNLASAVLEYDAENLVVYADVPSTYVVER